MRRPASRRPTAARWLAAALVAAIAPAAAAGAGARASGGEGLLAALERAPAVVVGRFESVSRVDLHGYSAQLRVEQALRGQPQPGAVLEVAWEELARERQPRFAKGERALVALERLPGASLWLQRFPEPGARQRVLAVAADGNAFWRRPTPVAIDILAHYLALDPASRDGAPGVARLAELLAGSEPEMSLAAARRLASVGDLDAKLDAPSAHAIARSLLRPDANDRLRTAVLELIGAQQLEATRAPLEALAASPDAPAVVFAALGRLDGALSAQRTAQLLAHGDPQRRREAARFAGGPDAPGLLEDALRADPDADVRAAAVARLVELRGERASDAAVAALADRDDRVRLAAARALGSLGAPVVPRLERVVENGSKDAALAAVAALKVVGAPGQDALLAIARDHPDEGVRTLARVVLGGPLDAHHRH